MATLVLQGLAKSFGTTLAVDRFDLTVPAGELVCLLGPSGSGKSTVLRMIGGFETPTSGRVLIDGQEVTRLPPERRPTSMMFQSHALWSHMTVAGNIGFGLRLRRLPRALIAQKVEEALALVGLAGLGGRRIDQLSGGQQQRVALARSLVLEPKILLLDEPFASLDQHLRERLREEVRDIQRRLGITMLFVTHGQDEALALADRIVVMQAGRVEQIDRPDRLYREPLTPFVAGFIGAMNLIAGRVERGRFRHANLEVAVPVPDGEGLLAIRPEALGLRPGPGGGQVHRMTDYGSHVVVEVTGDAGQRFRALMAADPGLPPGAPVRLAPSQATLYRDNAVAWRGAVEGVADV